MGVRQGLMADRERPHTGAPAAQARAKLAREDVLEALVTIAGIAIAACGGGSAQHHSASAGQPLTQWYVDTSTSPFVIKLTQPASLTGGYQGIPDPIEGGQVLLPMHTQPGSLGDYNAVCVVTEPSGIVVKVRDTSPAIGPGAQAMCNQFASIPGAQETGSAS